MNAFTSIVAEREAGVAGSVSPDAFVQVGLVRLWGRDLAIRAEHVREVVLRPRMLQPAFATGSAFVGTVVVRAQIVPVVDISPTVGFAGDDAEPAVIVVLRHDGELVGLLVHSVLGLTRIRAGEIQPFLFSPSNDVHVVGSSFAIDDRLIGIIDIAAIAGLPGVPRVREAARKDRDQMSIGQQKVLMLSVAGAELAIDAHLVVATVPGAHIRPAPSVSEDWVGVIDYLGLEVPVIDDTGLIGLSGCAADTRDTLVIILRLGEDRLLGLKADRVRRILSVHPRDIRPLPASVVDLPFFAGSVADGAGGQSLLLASDALTRAPGLQAIAGLTRRKRDDIAEAATHGGGAEGSRAKPQPYLVFRIGERRRACLLADITQIIPLPQDHGRLSCPGSALRGLASYGDGPVALVDLGTSTPMTAGAIDPRMVLIVQADGSATGFIVDALETIARVVAQDMPPIMQRSDAPGSTFIQVGIGGKEEAIGVCQLEQGHPASLTALSPENG